MATIGTVGTGLMAACHVQSALGPYIVWLLVGQSAMMSFGTAAADLAVTAPILAASVPLAGILAESPWLMLPFIGLITAFSTYLIVTRKLGTFGLLLQVIVLDGFYGVVFAPRDFGWNDAAVFGACAISFGLIALFDNWIWPDPAEAILLESIAGSLRHNRSRFLQATQFYLHPETGRRPDEPPATSRMSVQLDYLNRAVTEGITEHRRAILLAAITRMERLHIQVDRLAITVREDTPRMVRTMLQPELEDVCRAIAAAQEELAREATVMIRTGPDLPASPTAAGARQAIDTLNGRVGEVRHLYINRASGPEINNFGAFTETLAAMTRLLERPLDEPPPALQSAPAAKPSPARQADAATVRYSWKVGLCIVIGYFIGLITQRPDLSTILTTVIISALPTYGASLRKMILRNIGSLLGGAISLLAIIIVTPNFETLPSYMMVTFVVLLISGYTSLSSGRVAYAGKQVGTVFMLVFAGLSPSRDVYSPLWRTWGILLGTLVVTVVFFLLWPEYAGDSLLPRLRKVIADALALMPDGSAAASEAAIDHTDNEITRVLGEILEVADDARLEGRQSLIDHEAVVQSAGTIRRITHRLATFAKWRLLDPLPRLDDITEAAHDATVSAMRRRLEAWLAFYQSPQCLNLQAAMALAASHSRDQIAGPLAEFSSRIETDGYAMISSWTVTQRGRMLSELQSLNRLEFLMDELDAHLSHVPGAKRAAALPSAASATVRRVA